MATNGKISHGRCSPLAREAVSHRSCVEEVTVVASTEMKKPVFLQLVLWRLFPMRTIDMERAWRSAKASGAAVGNCAT